MKTLWLLLVLVVGIALPAQAAEQKKQNFQWLHPGAHPLVEMPTGQMLGKFADLLPKDVTAEFERQIASGLSQRTTIPQNTFFIRMLFGKGERVSRVVADVSQWPKDTSREATMYTISRAGRIYALVRPDVCKNWALVIIDAQGHCIRDRVTCSECSE